MEQLANNMREEHMRDDNSQGGDGRRAAHVKWDGKTIALGTFTAPEAAEKCERAKALTKKWRATMVPKPDVEWVKKALEKLHIRVVNDRPGRRKKSEIMEKERSKMGASSSVSSDEKMYAPSANRTDLGDGSMYFSSQQQGYNTNMPSSSVDNPMGSMNAYGIPASALMSSGGGMPSTYSNSRRYSNESGSGMATFNALNQMGSNMASNYDGNMSRNPYQTSQGRSLPLEMMNASGSPPGMDAAGGSRQHYAILKEHHDNLLKELQQTTYMMQMYQRNAEQENASMMNTAMYTPSAMVEASAMGPRRPSLPLRQSQYSNSSQFPYDYNPRRQSLGFSEQAAPQRDSAQGNYFSPPMTGGEAAFQMQNQNPNSRYPDVGRMATQSSMLNTINRPSESEAKDQGRRANAERPRGGYEAGRSGANAGYTAAQREEV